MRGGGAELQRGYVSKMRRRLPTLALLLAACEGTGPKAPPPSYAAGPTADTLIAPVVHVSDAFRRPDGTWVLLAAEELQVLVADFGADTVRPYPGMTREEVPGATVLIGVGDTAFVGDFGLRRVTAWTADGHRIDALPTPDALRGAFPRARDAAGQWYFEVTPRPGSDGRAARDSGAVVRADPLLTRFDTVVRLAPPDLAEVEQAGRMVLQTRALSGRDRWGVLRDGTLWLARVNNNQVSWIPPQGGKAARTDPLPDAILPVNETDRQLYIRRFPEEQRPNAQLLQFALVKPPFERAFADRDSRVWLFKSAPALDSVRSFQVADTAGWALSVTVPSYGTALGVADGEILMAEDFPGGIRLLRYQIPAEARP